LYEDAVMMVVSTAWSYKGCGVGFDMINVESMSFGNEK